MQRHLVFSPVVCSSAWKCHPIICILLVGGLERAMAPHSSTLGWKIPWTEEPGGLQSIGLRRVGHNWATSLSLFTFMYWRRKWQPTPVFLPGEFQGWGSLVAAVYGVTQSRTRLKWLSSRSWEEKQGIRSRLGNLLYFFNHHRKQNKNTHTCGWVL